MVDAFKPTEPSLLYKPHLISFKDENGITIHVLLEKRGNRDLHAFTELLLVALLIFSIPGSTMAGGKLEKNASKSKHADAKLGDSSVTIPSELFERLLEDYEPQTVADLFGYLSIDPEGQREIYPAYQIAEKTAKEKRRSLSTTGTGKIVLKLGAVAQSKA